MGAAGRVSWVSLLLAVLAWRAAGARVHVLGCRNILCSGTQPTVQRPRCAAPLPPTACMCAQRSSYLRLHIRLTLLSAATFKRHCCVYSTDSPPRGLVVPADTRIALHVAMCMVCAWCPQQQSVSRRRRPERATRLCAAADHPGAAVMHCRRPAQGGLHNVPACPGGALSSFRSRIASADNPPLPPAAASGLNAECRSALRLRPSAGRGTALREAYAEVAPAQAAQLRPPPQGVRAPTAKGHAQRRLAPRPAPPGLARGGNGSPASGSMPHGGSRRVTS